MQVFALADQAYEVKEERLGGIFSWLLEELTGGRAVRARLCDPKTHAVLAEGIGSTKDEAIRRAQAALKAAKR